MRNLLLFALLLCYVSVNLANLRRGQKFSFRPSSSVWSTEAASSLSSNRDSQLNILEQKLTRKFQEKLSRLKLNQNSRLSSLEQNVRSLTTEVRNRSRDAETLKRENEDFKLKFELQQREIDEIKKQFQHLETLVKTLTSDEGHSQVVIGGNRSDVTSVNNDENTDDAQGFPAG